MLRRFVLSIALALAVFGCSSTSTQTAQQQIATAAQDVASIASGLKTALPLIANATNLTQATQTQIAFAIADLQNAATQLASAATTAQAQGIVQQVETDVNAVVSAVAAAQGLPKNVQTIVAAAAIVLPAVETALNMAITPAPAPASSTFAAAMAPRYGATAARAGAACDRVCQALAILNAAPALVK